MTSLLLSLKVFAHSRHHRYGSINMYSVKESSPERLRHAMPSWHSNFRYGLNLYLTRHDRRSFMTIAAAVPCCFHSVGSWPYLFVILKGSLPWSSITTLTERREICLVLVRRHLVPRRLHLVLQQQDAVLYVGLIPVVVLFSRSAFSLAASIIAKVLFFHCMGFTTVKPFPYFI